VKNLAISTKEPLSPKVGGFAFVMDPSATPSKHAPIVTWGEIEGTPLLLDPTTPLHVGGGAANIAPSEFAVPQTPRRDQVGHDLADKVRQKQAQKKKAEKVSKTQGNATPRSETAQKLINKLKRTPADPQLRASYTPIVHDSASSGKSGISTPRTPSTPVSVHEMKSKTSSTTNSSTTTTSKSSLTDGLINL